ncbi:MAG: phosphate acetyltransferase [Azospirillaceae bacterium]|nr:phosphate acetyltransferase [Azospirillaceae bacterium]
MDANSNPHTFYLVPVSREVGLTSMALGLVRALVQAGVKVGFVKPVVQPGLLPGHEDLGSHYARKLCGVAAPDPIAFEHAAELVRTGQLPTLMEEIVALVATVRAHCDVVVVEGMIADADIQIATRLNVEIARSLGAELIPVVSGERHGADDLDAVVTLAGQQYGDGGRRPVAGVLVNMLEDAAAAAKLRADSNVKVPLLAAVPQANDLAAPRLTDIVDSLGLEVLQAGNLATTRVAKTLVAAGGPETLLQHLRPDTLVVTPGDRSDAIVATSLAGQQGMPLAGLLLTCGEPMAPGLMQRFTAAPLDRMSILMSQEDTFTVGAKLAQLTHHVGADDPELTERLIAFIAGKITVAPLLARLKLATDTLMSPPIFRHRLVELARSAPKRIVLPEGDEPRTIRAAAICAEKGIAQCVLLGSPSKIHAIAAAEGITLPGSIEIIDPDGIRRNYVAPMVELRKAKGLTAPQAEKQLEDTVVLGTMMLAQGDVDGLVSGAVHTTASTIRPALQLIKTAPGSSIVSSVFFMLLPDQVLVYGDCAINPDPTATELAEIAMQSADSAKSFGVEPRVAMISYSTGSSGAGSDVEKVREATALVRQRRPELIIDGPIQYDAASVESVGAQKAPGSPLHGHATVFVFPDLNTGNTTYKAVQRSANVVSVGPMLQGLRKPVNDLSRGALVDDIIFTIALTAIQAQN